MKNNNKVDKVYFLTNFTWRWAEETFTHLAKYLALKNFDVAK